jgi:outer membrane protein
MKRKILLPVLLQIVLAGSLFSQDNKWDLQRCVEYAWANNITIKQSKVQAELAEVDLNENKWAQYPSVDFSNSTGLQWGRSIDPTTNSFTTNQLLFQSFNLSAGATIYNWGRIKNSILAARYSRDAYISDVEKARNDIALNVATYYLQVLLARQQMDIARVQMGQTLSQLQVTRKKVDAGAVPELDALTLEGQYASDSSNYITSISNVDQAVLTLKQALNLDAGAIFEVAAPPVEQIPVEPILQLQPETVFGIAVKSQPAQKSNELRIQSLQASVAASKSRFYPTISVGGGLGTNFSSPNKEITGATITGYNPSGDQVTIGPDKYLIYSPVVQFQQSKKSFGEVWSGWGTQMNNNFRQNIGVSIAVPILSGGAAKFNYERSKLNLKNAQVTKEQIDQTLKNDIYKAYYSASAALQKFNAAKTSVLISQKTYDFAVKRYDLGLLNTFDLVTSQNTLTRAKLDLASSQFDYVFKMKVLEFYKGQGIKLTN